MEWVGHMRGQTRYGITAAAISIMTAAASISAGAAHASGPVPMNSVLRNCDFSPAGTAVQVSRTNLGHGTAVFSSTGSTVTAQVSIVISNRAGAHYDVALIQAPRPSSQTCGPGDPGVNVAGVDTDGVGLATVTITAPLRQGATGAWVMVTAPSEFNQAPSEFYSTEYVAPV